MDMIEQLQEIGFNRLEATVYLQLLSQPPTTAYKIGKLLKKPTYSQNIYMSCLLLAGALKEHSIIALSNIQNDQNF